MKKEYDLSRRDSTRARPPALLPERPEASEKTDPPMHRLVQPFTSYFKCIEDLLGNFSDQTGANFG